MTLRPLSGTEAVRLVATREITERIRTKSLRWGTLAMVVLGVGLALLPRILPDSDDPEWTVAVVGEAPTGLAELLDTRGELESASVVLEPTDRNPEQAARDGDIDAVLVGGDVLVVEREVPERLELILSAAIGQATLADDLAGLGVTPAEAAALFDPARLEVRSLDGEDDDGPAREGVAFLGTLALFVAIVTYGGWVMNGVLEEKSNRIVEIVVAAIRPSELLAGKVIGVGLLGVAQLTLVLGAAGAAAALFGTLPDLPDFVPAAVGSTFGWFLLGFAFYAVGYAAAGSLTSRQEDAQSAVAPLMTLVFVAYFVSATVVNQSPDSTAARVVSLLPPITPLAMPVRMAHGSVPVWEVGLAVVLMLVATWLMVRLAARIYTGALLHSGGRIKALTALRSQS